MISFGSILSTIKTASLSTKVGLSVGTVAVVVGGTVGTVAIISNAQNWTSEEQQITINSSENDNSSLDAETTELEEIGEAEDDNNQTKQPAGNTQVTTNINSSQQPSAQKTNNSTASSSNNSNSGSSPNSASSSTSSPTPSQASTPAQSQPSQPSPSTPQADYNLNKTYYLALCNGNIGGSFMAVASTAEAATNACVAKMVSAARNQSEYAGMSDSEIRAAIGGMGSAALLTEAICTEYGLSCDRW